MTDHAFTDNPVLLDPNLAFVNSKREQKTNTMTLVLSVVSMVLIGSVMIIFGALNFESFPIVVIGPLLGYGYLLVSSHRMRKLFHTEIIASRDAIQTAVQNKYNLELVDPPIFNYDSKTINVSSDPLRALDSARFIYVQVTLHLSADNRDVTASVLTPAMV